MQVTINETFGAYKTFSCTPEGSSWDGTKRRVAEFRTKVNRNNFYWNAVTFFYGDRCEIFTQLREKIAADEIL